MYEEHGQQPVKPEIFKSLSPDQIAEIYENSRQVSFNKGDLIFFQGDSASAFFIVLEGWVTVIRESKNAEKTVLHILKEGDSFAEPAAIILGAYPANAYAATNCKLLEIKTEEFKRLLEREPDIAMQVISLLSHRLAHMAHEFEQHKTLSISQRLALFLLNLVPDLNDTGQVTVELPFSKTVLATYLSTQPESLSRAFRQLKQEGVTSSGRAHIEIADINRLHEFANHH